MNVFIRFVNELNLIGLLYKEKYYMFSAHTNPLKVKSAALPCVGQYSWQHPNSYYVISEGEISLQYEK